VETFEAAKALFLEGLEALKALDYKLAEGKFLESLRRWPDRVSTLTNLSTAQIRLGKYKEAEKVAERLLQLAESNCETWLNIGLIEKHKNNPEDALECFERAIRIRPDYVEAWFNRGVTLYELKRYEEALTHYARAIELKPDYAEAWSNRGVTLYELKRYEEALTHYARAIELKPDDAEFWSNRGVTLNALKRYDEVVADYTRAIELKPDSAFLLGDLIYAKLRICDWRDYQAEKEELVRKVQLRQRVSIPFAVVALQESEETNMVAARIWVSAKFPVDRGNQTAPFIINTVQDEGKIRLGYFSSDFHNHATSYLMAEFFELHDRKRFELVAFSFGPECNDESRQRLKSTFDKFVDVRSKSDREVAELSRRLGIRIAVDLKGHTYDSRTGIFACRAAPLQVNYLGYPASMGAGYMDYIIGDRTVIPESNRSCFTEKIVYLPDCYQVNDRKRMISDRKFTRIDLGLPEDGFVFCCFNNNYKITPAAFDRWMRILRKVEGSVLWLFEDNPSARGNLVREASSRGVTEDRLVFAKRMNLAEHLARLRLADLFIDTLPYNAHTTASDALWVGLPVITQVGDTFAGRVAASLLYAVGLPELVVSSDDEYEDLAVRLASDARRLEQIRQKLSQNRSTTALFDTPLVTQHIEAGYLEMYRRHENGLPPDDIYVGT